MPRLFTLLALCLALPVAQAASLKDFELTKMLEKVAQDSSVGTTRPTPLPERVGAIAAMCSGPSWRR